MKNILLVVLAVATGSGFALLPGFAGTWKMWVIGLGPYLLLAPFALAQLKRHKELGRALRVQGGDTSIGIVLGGASVVCGALALRSLAAPGSAGFSWLLQLYRHVGPYQKEPFFIVLLLLTVAGEELVWRGLVLRELRQRIGVWSIPASAALYALAHVPTLVALQDPHAGPNPLVVAAAAVMGVVWAALVHTTGRLSSAVLAHAVFSYFLGTPLPNWVQL